MNLRRPRGPGWVRDRSYAPPPGAYVDAPERWYYAPYGVATLVAVTSIDRVEERGPTWHVSVSALCRDGLGFAPMHASDEQLALAREAFRMQRAEEDNHALADGRSPGVARHLFMEVDPSKRSLCECKTTEVVETLPDGYSYSRPRSGSWEDSEP